MADEDGKKGKRTDGQRLARRAADAMRKEEKLAPLVFVVPPLATALDAIQSVVATEVAFIQQEQARDNTRLDAQDAKKLQALTGALAQSISAKRTLTDDELGKMSDEELEAALVEELEELRAKRSKSR